MTSEENKTKSGPLTSKLGQMLQYAKQLEEGRQTLAQLILNSEIKTAFLEEFTGRKCSELEEMDFDSVNEVESASLLYILQTLEKLECKEPTAEPGLFQAVLDLTNECYRLT